MSRSNKRRALADFMPAIVARLRSLKTSATPYALPVCEWLTAHKLPAVAIGEAMSRVRARLAVPTWSGDGAEWGERDEALVWPTLDTADAVARMLRDRGEIVFAAVRETPRHREPLVEIPEDLGAEVSVVVFQSRGRAGKRCGRRHSPRSNEDWHLRAVNSGGID